MVDRQRIFLGLIIVTLTFGSVGSINAQSENLFVDYDNKISMIIPSIWEQTQAPIDSVVTFSSPLENEFDTYYELLGITTESLVPCAQTTLNEYTTELITYYQNELDIIPINDVMSTYIDDIPAYALEYVIPYGLDGIYNYQIIAIHNNIAYIITYNKMDSDIYSSLSFLEALNMINTIQIDRELTNIDETMLFQPSSETKDSTKQIKYAMTSSEMDWVGNYHHVDHTAKPCGVPDKQNIGSYIIPLQ